MAEIKPTASVKATSVQPKKSSNAISWIAPVVCIIAGYAIWRFILGSADGPSLIRLVDSGLTTKDPKMPFTGFTKGVSSFPC